MHKLLLVIILGITTSFSYKIYASTSNQQASNRQDTEQTGRVTLYTKTGCIYCEKAKQLLKEANISYQEVDLTTEQAMAKQLCHTTKQCTVPYVYVDNHLIGGYQELKELYDNNEI